MANLFIAAIVGIALFSVTYLVMSQGNLRIDFPPAQTATTTKTTTATQASATTSVTSATAACPQIYCIWDPCPGKHLPDQKGCVSCASPCATTITTSTSSTQSTIQNATATTTAATSEPSEISCKGNALCAYDTVTDVVDGDTIVTQKYGTIRLALVNTPEKDHEDYQLAKDFTTDYCLDQEALIDQDDGQPVDQFGRKVAVVYCQDLNLNEELYFSGLAAVETQFCSQSEFANEEWAVDGGC